MAVEARTASQRSPPSMHVHLAARKVRGHGKAVQRQVLHPSLAVMALQRSIERAMVEEAVDRDGNPAHGAIAHEHLLGAMRIASGSNPAASAAATPAPTLVPPMKSIATPASFSAFATPIWAQPNTPPPPSTSPVAVPVMNRARRSKSDWLSSATW